MRTETREYDVSIRGRADVGKLPRFVSAEDRLLPRLRLGEEQAFEELVTQQHDLLIRIAMRYVASRDVAEEVVQDTWMTVVLSIERFEGRSSLRAWICGILIHKAKDRGVREKRHTTFSSFEFHGESHGDATSSSRFCWYGDYAVHRSFSRQLRDDRTPEKLLLSKQGVDCIQRTIDALPRNLKEVLILRDVEGLESSEVCTRLHVTQTNLYVRLHRARQHVRVAMVTTTE